MALSRRQLLQLATRAGLASATAPLWSNFISTRAFAQSSGSYKAIVVVTLPGGNDGNNMLIPLDAAEYAQYNSLRPMIALPQQNALVLHGASGAATYGLHPSLANVAALYNQGRAAVVANVGPLLAPATKQQLQANPALVPGSLLSHPNGRAQWESASTVSVPTTGWGGRIADIIAPLSGSLPPILDAGPASVFTVGKSVQAIAVQANTGSLVPLPSGIDSAILAIAQADTASENELVAQAAALRIAATQQQVRINQAKTAGASLQTRFPGTGFGRVMQTIAQVIAGRSVVGASRQIFYCNQGSYDTHQNQLNVQPQLLRDLDGGLGAFMTALTEMGLANQVLVCTHSDFNRTMQANATGGTDHAWGNHQLVLGGGIKGGRVLGTMPSLEIGGSSDLFTQGVWIPTQSVTQLTAGIGQWMGLTSSQLASVFPDLRNFPQGALSLT